MMYESWTVSVILQCSAFKYVYRIQHRSQVSLSVIELGRGLTFGCEQRSTMLPTMLRISPS